MPEPDFFNDLGKLLFRTIQSITFHYERAGYNLDVMRQAACLVFSKSGLIATLLISIARQWLGLDHFIAYPRGLMPNLYFWWGPVFLLESFFSFQNWLSVSEMFATKPILVSLQGFDLIYIFFRSLNDLENLYVCRTFCVDCLQPSHSTCIHTLQFTLMIID